MEDAGELRQKAQRWRVLARSLNDRDDWQRIVAIATQMERLADALSARDRSDIATYPLSRKPEAL
jgi:hypothetical protein